MRRLISSLIFFTVLGGGIAYFVWGDGTFPWPFTRQTPVIDEPLPELPLPYATTPEIGRLAPDFLLKTVAGKEISLSALLGKPVIITFWTSWCPLCRSQLQDMKRLATEHRGRVHVLAINRGEPDMVVSEFSRQLGGEGDNTILLDPGEDISRLYRISTLPVTLYIDENGVVRERRDDSLAYDDLRFGLGLLYERPWAP